MRKIQIAFDLDGCICDNDVVLIDEISKILGIHSSMLHSPPVYDITKYYGLTQEEENTCLSNMYGRWEDSDAVPGAVELIRILCASTLEPVSIITSRPIWSAMDTYDLLTNLFGDKETMFNVYFTQGNKKSDFVKSLGYKYYLEDRRRYAVELADSDIMVFLLDKEYNRMDERNNIIRINTVWQLHKIIPQFIGLDVSNYPGDSHYLLK